MTEREIFAAALQHDEGDGRAAYLNEACGDDQKLRQRVELLLRAHEKAGSFLDLPSDEAGPTIEMPVISEGPGTVIGRYKLLQQIGEGGMGVVFMAEQREPVRRKVALKIIKPGMDTKEVIARFEAERQALALMDHPNIAKVLDAGATDTGRPYFVMDLVRGVPITDFCDQNDLTPRERLDLFVSVCQAVQHAHQKGIIHRDIKPSNVLVTLDDTGPVVKVIDFGVAKATGCDLTDKTLFTRFDQMVGTPMYMSPEQTEMRTRGVDTRSDIYSLGVLLYELLTGTTPFDRDRLHSAVQDEICRIIREEEPPKPSNRISTLGESATAVAQHRKMEPGKLTAFVRGDLDWIVMKALEKDRSRRYETAKEFSNDVLRHVNHEPIEARSPSIPYKLSRFYRRNRITVLVASVIVFLLLGAIGGTTTGWAIALRQNELRKEAYEKIRRQAYIYAVNLAGEGMDSHNFSSTVSLLKQQMPADDEEDLREFAWYHIWHQCKRGISVPRREVGIDIRSMSLSPDGTSMAIAGIAGAQILNVTENGISNSALSKELNRVSAKYAAFSPDGRTFAAFARSELNEGIWVWDCMSSDRIPEPTFLSVSFDGIPPTPVYSPSGDLLAAVGTQNSIHVWGLSGGRQAAKEKGPVVLTGHDRPVASLVFVANGRSLASADRDDRTPMIWEAVDGASEWRSALQGFALDAPITALAAAHNQDRLAIGTQSGSIYTLDLASSTPEELPFDSESRITTLQFSSDDALLAAGHADNTVTVWDVRRRLLLDVLWGHTRPVESLIFVRSDDGRPTLLTGSSDRTIAYWEIETDKYEKALVPPKVTCCAFSSNDGRLVLGGVDGSVMYRSMEQDTAPAILYLHETPVRALAVSPDGKVASACQRELRISGPGQSLQRDVSGSVSYLAFSPDGKTLAVAMEHGGVSLWELASDRWFELAGPKCANAMVFSDDGKHLYTDGGVGDNVLAVYNIPQDLEDAAVIARKPVYDMIVRMDVSPDGRHLALACRNDGVRILDALSLADRTRLTEHAGDATAIAYAPDGRTLAAVGRDQTLRLWDTETYQLKATWSCDMAGWRSHLDFSPDGKVLAFVNSEEEGTLSLWRTANTREVEGLDW